jgi:hypothetical protein
MDPEPEGDTTIRVMVIIKANKECGADVRRSPRFSLLEDH